MAEHNPADALHDELFDAADERQLGEVPEAAVEAAAKARWTWQNPFVPWAEAASALQTLSRELARECLTAACDPALGDQRLVPLADVLNALRSEHRHAIAEDPDFARNTFDDCADFLARTFGGEPDER